MKPRDALSRFARSTRAGATSIAALAVAVVALGSGGLATDYLWLLDQRDTLKRAANAAAVASTIELNDAIGKSGAVDEDQLVPRLERISRRYVEYNLAHLDEQRRARAKETLDIDVTIIDGRMVNLVVTADLGGLLFLPWIPIFNIDPDIGSVVRVRSGVESTITAAEVVLAIDISASMVRALDGSMPGPGTPSRMQVVRAAARNLVDVLDPSDESRVAVGIVPWGSKVRLNPAERASWSTRGWARYPARRRYAHPYECAYLSCQPRGRAETLPTTPPEPWYGCLEEHRIAPNGVARNPDPGNRIALPGHQPFAQAFYPASRGFGYRCLPLPYPTDLVAQFCYEAPSSNITYLNMPQYQCSINSMLSLTNDRATIDRTIDGITPAQNSTYSALGVLWAHRMLEPTWRDVWGGEFHPAAPTDPGAQDLTKAIVLLTDGQDTYCERVKHSCQNSRIGVGRTEACQAARAAGILMFVIAANAPTAAGNTHRQALRACSSESDDPEGTYVFVENRTRADLEAAFASIAQQLVSLRRTH